VSCQRDCKFGFLGTEEIPLDHGQRLGEGLIGMHLEFMARVGERTSVRLCPCQNDPREMTHEQIIAARKKPARYWNRGRQSGGGA
jgi:hypothetical protein